MTTKKMTVRRGECMKRDSKAEIKSYDLEG